MNNLEDKAIEKRHKAKDIKARACTLLVRVLALVSIFVFICFAAACGGTSGGSVSNNAPLVPLPEKTLTGDEKELNSLKEAFDVIFVFRRKDGGKFDSEDKKFLKANAPLDTNRWVLSDDESSVMAGSNYSFSKDNLEALRKRFDVQDFSKIISDNSTQNTNVKK
jgi:hypothetical protein